MGERLRDALARYAEGKESRMAQVRGLEVLKGYLVSELERVQGLLAEATGQLNAMIGAEQALEELLGGGEGEPSPPSGPSPPTPLPTPVLRTGRERGVGEALVLTAAEVEGT